MSSVDGSDDLIGEVWTTAGCRAGLCLGAGLGGIAFVGRSAALVLIGSVVGGVVGALFGLVVGSANGFVLQRLATTSALGTTSTDRACRSTAASVLTTLVTGLALELTLFVWLVHAVPLAWLAYLPVALGALTAAVLSRRLPPGRA